MKYVNADLIFPEELLKEVQKYIPGGIVYIPKPNASKKKWGEQSGARAYLNHRNEQIRRMFADGLTISQLSEHYSLSCDSIKKIVYNKKQT